MTSPSPADPRSAGDNRLGAAVIGETGVVTALSAIRTPSIRLVASRE